MKSLKFGVVAPVAAGVTADPRWMAAFARHLEACGFESIVVVEHTVLATRYDSVYPYDPSGRVELAADCPVPDPLDLLSFMAAHTERLGLALTDAVGDRRTQNQPGTTDEYPNWRVPLSGPDGRPVLLEEVFTDPRATALAEVMRAETAVSPT